MAEANQYSVTHKELIELIIKHADVHDGRWHLMAKFGFAGGNFGPKQDEIVPGVVVGLQNVGIQRVLKEDKVPAVVTVDAAEVNPPPKTYRKRSKTSTAP